MNILIVKLGALGDVIRTSYILPGLRRKYGKAAIYWLTASSSVDLLRYNPHISRIITPAELEGVAASLSFDLVISLDEEVEILRLLQGLRYAQLIGASLCEGRPVYTDKGAEWFDMGLISRFGKEQADALKRENCREHNEIFADMLGISIETGEFFNATDIEEQSARLFQRSSYNIGINCGAGKRWISKQLPVAETVKLIERLLVQQVNGKKTRVYLFGGPEEEERHCLIRQSVKSERLMDAGSSNSLLEFAALIKCCDYIITSDSLALHLAVAQGVKNLSFYAPTSAAEIGTFGTGVKLVSLAGDYCSYRPDADNSTITADRIMALFHSHLALLDDGKGNHQS